MRHRKIRRKKYFLTDTVQPKLIFKVYLLLISVMIISGVIFYFIGNKSLTREFFQAHSVIQSTMQILAPALILVNIVGLVGASFMVVMFTHTIAGPIYRLRKLSEKIAGGDLSLKVKFRKRDIVHELSDIINNVSEGLNLRLQKLNDLVGTFQGMSGQIKKISELSESELVSLKRELLEINSEFVEEMEKFKL